MRILVTGAAGFIGYHLVARLLREGWQVYGLDNLNDYYDVTLKEDRLKQINAMRESANFQFFKADLAAAPRIAEIFKTSGCTHVVNLAAQAGVRYSLVNPSSYINSNLVGFANILECCRNFQIQHLVYASSSSVYGLNAARPYSVHQNVDHPVSLYAASKKSNELMAHAYSNLFKIPCTGLRFFTVYGPWGRPDMALYLFTDAILNDKPIKIFNNGQLRRDFTYIDDIVEGVYRIVDKPAQANVEFDAAAPDPATSSAPWRLYNIGNNQTVALGEFISVLEDALGKKAIKQMLPMQPGDVESTWADVADFERKVNFRPNTSLKTGIANYVKWHRAYYGHHDAR